MKMTKAGDILAPGFPSSSIFPVAGGPARQGSAQHFSEEFLLPQHKSAVREASYSEKTKSEEDCHVDSGQFALIYFAEGSLTNLN